MKNRYIRICYLIVLFLYFQIVPIAILWADETSIHFKRLSVDDGLSYNTVLALTQDHNNKIWVGTTEGLNWHDGFRFASISILFILTAREPYGQGRWLDFPGIIL